MAPEALNGIEIRAIGWQELRQYPLIQDGKGSVCGSTMMVGGVVHNEYHRFIRGQLLNDKVEKGNKGIAVFRSGGQGDHLVGQEIVRTKEMVPLLLTRCGNAFLLATFHPAGTQNRVQA